MVEIISEAFVDAVKTVPLLLVIYVAIELAEYKFGAAIINKIKRAGPAGPFLGALAGIFPQCGFSVIATALYAQRLVTVGTLLAVYLSTSDEALPILLSRPDMVYLVLPLVLTKFFIALAAGYAIDFIFRVKNQKILEHIVAYSDSRDDKNHRHESAVEEQACCGHSASAASKKFRAKELLFHPTIHTFKIFVFIFVISAIINLLIESIGAKTLSGLFSQSQILAPLIAALVGLIPSCAASVAIIELFIGNLISYGAAIAGLSSSAGLGILVLLKEEKNKKDIILILGLLFSISVIAGLSIQLFQ